MSRLIDASTRTDNKIQATTRMSREQVKEVLMNCRANPKHIEDCAVCPLFDVHVNCVSRMADEALEVIEEDEDKIRTLNELALDMPKAQMPTNCYDCWIRQSIGCRIANDSGWLNDRRDDKCPLKAQEPVKPIRLENWWECPSCNGNIVANMKYCPGCGRKVKWDG